MFDLGFAMALECALLVNGAVEGTPSGAIGEDEGIGEDDFIGEEP